MIWEVASAAFALLIVKFIFGRLSTGEKANATLRKIQEISIANKRKSVWAGKHIVVILNPFGGGGKAKKVWSTLVESTLIDCNITYDLIETQRAKHAYTLMKKDLNIEKYQGLMVISGDGMLHEVLNGLFDRAGHNISVLKDISSKMPILVIPGGTMNGFASSLAHKRPEDALYSLCTSGREMWIDAYIVQSKESGYKAIDVHCVSGGIVADHDHLLERKFRWLPSFLRLPLAQLIVISKKTSYAGTLYLKPSQNQSGFGITDISKLDPDDKGREGWRVIKDRFLFLTLINTSHAAYDMHWIPSAAPDDGSIYCMIVRDNVTRWTMIKILLAFETATHLVYPEVEVYRVDRAEYFPDNPSVGIMGISGEEFPNGPTEIAVEANALKFIK
jgi:sphingosine kinase